MNSLKPWTFRTFALFLMLSAAAFVTLTIWTFDMEDHDRAALSWFWLFALLPGLIGIANYMVAFRQHSDDAGPVELQHRPKFSETFAAAAVLTAIFLIVAKADASKADFKGLVYAGYGAYISTLWFMLVRLNASALSPRFLINSALKTSIAMLIAFMASRTDLFKNLSPALYFLIGFCLNWAIKALRTRAMATFNVAQTATAADLPVRLLEGVDDGAVDVLEELGITSIQHLATMHAPEVCGRSQYPRDRVLDWIDQSILAMHTNGRINEFRAIGIRSAYSLITIADYAYGYHKDEKPLNALATTRLDEAAQRLGMTVEALEMVAECIRRDPSFIDLDASYPHRHEPKCPPTTSVGDASVPLPTEFATHEPVLHARSTAM